MNNNLTDLPKLIQAETEKEYPFKRNNIDYVLVIRYRRFIITSRTVQYGLQIYNSTDKNYEPLRRSKDICTFKTKGDLVKFIQDFFKKQ